MPYSDLPTPDRGRSGDLGKKNWEILQKVVRFHFLADQDKTNPFSVRGISCVFKNFLFFQAVFNNI